MCAVSGRCHKLNWLHKRVLRTLWVTPGVAQGPSIERFKAMDKGRIEGAARQAKGAVKMLIGKITGDAKLEAEGKVDKAAGKVQNTVGGLKDTLRGK
jgi:uncharacterized protein YjbJ (UPF0337 family)